MVKNHKTSSFFALLISAAIYASFGVLIRELKVDFGQFFQITVRSLVAVIILGVMLIVSRAKITVSRKDLPRVIAFALSFPFVIALFTLAVLHTKIANAVLLLYAGSLSSSFIIGTLFFKEKVTKQKLLALLMVIIGLIVFTEAWAGVALGVGFVYGITSGLMDGVANSLRKYIHDLPRNTMLFFQYVTVVVFSLALAFITHEKMVKQLTFRPLLATIVFGVLLIFLGRLLLYGFKHTDVNVATITLASELLFSVILGYYLLKERPAGHELVGGIIIFVASVASGLDLSKLKPLKRTKRR